MQSVRDMLRRDLARTLQPLPPLDRLAAAWPVACGSALATHGEITAYVGTEVRVRVAGPDWQDTFGHMRGILASDLARIAGVPVTAIHFDLHPVRKP